MKGLRGAIATLVRLAQPKATKPPGKYRCLSGLTMDTPVMARAVLNLGTLLEAPKPSNIMTECCPVPGRGGAQDAHLFHPTYVRTIRYCIRRLHSERADRINKYRVSAISCFGFEREILRETIQGRGSLVLPCIHFSSRNCTPLLSPVHPSQAMPENIYPLGQLFTENNSRNVGTLENLLIITF